VGDDAKEAVRITQARLSDGTNVPFEAVGKIGPLTFPPAGQSLEIEIVLEEARRVSMEVSAHEA